LEAVDLYRKRGRDASKAEHIWGARLREMLRERLLDRMPSEEFLARGREVAEKLRDPYSVIHEWLEQY
jgi:hypothetical protein